MANVSIDRLQLCEDAESNFQSEPQSLDNDELERICSQMVEHLNEREPNNYLEWHFGADDGNSYYLSFGRKDGERATEQLATANEKIAELEAENRQLKAQPHSQQGHSNGDFNALSKEAQDTAKGMIEHCINHGYCMGMDEGFDNFDQSVKHHFRIELEDFVGINND